MAAASGPPPVSPLPRPPSDPHWRDELADRWDGVVDRLRRTQAAGWTIAVVTGATLLALAALWVLRPRTEVRPEDLLPVIDPVAFAPTATAQTFVVHVAGAVARPGVHSFDEPIRVVDAITGAGGPTADADLDRVNLAAPVLDGDRLYIPIFGETPPAIVAQGPADAATVTGPIDLNQANVELLEQLPGIGPATAAAIVRHRDQHGRFESVDQLDDVAGIGPARLEQLRPLVTVG